MPKNIYKIEITDTFGGEANYSWVRRYFVAANSERGAVQIIARVHGAGWRMDYPGRYKMVGQCICMFVDEIEENEVRECFKNKANIYGIPADYFARMFSKG